MRSKLKRKFHKTTNFLDKITTWNGKAPQIITRLSRYSITGIISGTVDLILLIILVELFNIYYLLAAAVAFMATHSMAYLINSKWGFRDSTAGRIKGYYYFIFFGVVGIGLTIILLRIGVELLNIHYIIARIFVGIIVGIYNFSMNFFITFKMGLDIWKKKK